MDLATAAAEIYEEIERHNRWKMADYTILDVDVINSEHFPFNVTRYWRLGQQALQYYCFNRAIYTLSCFQRLDDYVTPYTEPLYMLLSVDSALRLSEIQYALRYKDLTTQIVSGLYFAPGIKSLARDIVQKMSSGKGLTMGLHLRFEADALSAWASDTAAQEVSLVRLQFSHRTHQVLIYMHTYQIYALLYRTYWFFCRDLLHDFRHFGIHVI